MSVFINFIVTTICGIVLLNFFFLNKILIIMNIYNLNELSTTSESDSEYLVDSRYCRTTVKCKRKALKKTIKLIHGRCVVIYRGSGDLLPIAAKDADRNCYCGK